MLRLRERPPAQAADGGAGDWMWPLLTRDQVKWLGRQDKTRERKPAQKRTKQAAAAPSTLLGPLGESYVGVGGWRKVPLWPKKCGVTPKTNGYKTPKFAPVA